MSRVKSPAPRTHCENGHALDYANTYITPTGRMQCRACGRANRYAHKLRSGWTPKYKRGFCKRGHAIEGHNSMPEPKTGTTRCRICCYAASAASKQRRREAEKKRNAEMLELGRRPDDNPGDTALRT